MIKLRAVPPSALSSPESSRLRAALEWKGLVVVLRPFELGEAWPAGRARAAARPASRAPAGSIPASPGASRSRPRVGRQGGARAPRRSSLGAGDPARHRQALDLASARPSTCSSPPSCCRGALPGAPGPACAISRLPPRAAPTPRANEMIDSACGYFCHDRVCGLEASAPRPPPTAGARARSGPGSLRRRTRRRSARCRASGCRGSRRRLPWPPCPWRSAASRTRCSPWRASRCRSLLPAWPAQLLLGGLHGRAVGVDRLLPVAEAREDVRRHVLRVRRRRRDPRVPPRGVEALVGDGREVVAVDQIVRHARVVGLAPRILSRGSPPP